MKCGLARTKLAILKMFSVIKTLLFISILSWMLSAVQCYVKTLHSGYLVYASCKLEIYACHKSVRDRGKPANMLPR